ncbi:hypothetical protein BD779DRAFT_1525883 [Infundibulicybe gibba]|nr:hypothetical protein BD779DRAFT_1525883 [Infundibulicybe gibba]
MGGWTQLTDSFSVTIMDFFTAATLAAPADDASSPAHFAHAIAARTPLSLPKTVPLPESPMANMSLSPSPAPSAHLSTLSITTITPASLDAFILDSAVLILDIRPHAAYSSARIPHAVSLSVPSTLLRRPLFSLEKLSAMLPSQNSRARFTTWPSASKILVYDADASAIPPTSNIHGLLHKFHNDQFSGQLAWLQGGFQAIWRERKDLVDTSPPTPDSDEDEDDVRAHSNRAASTTLHRPNVLRASNLPTSAFSHTSTTASQSRPASRRTAPLSLSSRFAQANPATAAGHNGPPTMTMAMPSQDRPAFNPFFDTIRQNIELSHGITDRIPLRLPRRVRRRIHELPFPWLQQIARRAANMPPSHHWAHGLSSSSASSEDDDSGADPADVEEGTEALAMQFYRIELAEQRRLMGVMEHHSKESGGLHGEASAEPSMNFPFSITAGVEKGAKNRYRNIWPFEHARVRLHQKREADDDYINASYVQPIGTTKRYIATQGPLPATYTDFWTLVWEQNVQVIVMLTREVEGAMVKCGCYWTDTRYGPLSLRLIESVGEDSVEPTPASTLHFPPKNFTSQSTSAAAGGFFRPEHIPNESGHGKAQSPIIRRTFELTHSGYLHAKPRRVIQLQYLEWPDMNVPDDPRGVLGLITEVDQAVREVNGKNVTTTEGGLGVAQGLDAKIGLNLQELDPHTGIARHALGQTAPVLLHCSAGVGRTGGFIAVDAVLDAVREEVRKRTAKAEREKDTVVADEGEAMDVDILSGTEQGSGAETVGFDAARGGGASPLHPIVTVPIIVSAGRAAYTSGEIQGPEHVAGEAKADSGLVVHVPVAPSGSGMRTPMQFKHDGWVSGGAGPIGGEGLTRRWAEGVREETRRGKKSRDPSQISQKELLNREQLNQHRRQILELRQKRDHQQNDHPPSSSPPPPSSSSPPVFVSYSGSGSSSAEDSVFTFSPAPPPSSSQSQHGTSSSLGTSISNSSTPPFFLSQSLRSAPGIPATQTKRVTLPVVGEAGEHRIRTSSAPVRATVPLGPSPLASTNSSAPWLAVGGAPSQKVVSPLGFDGGIADAMTAQLGPSLISESASHSSPAHPPTTSGPVRDKEISAPTPSAPGSMPNSLPNSATNSPPDIVHLPPHIHPTAPSSMGGIQYALARDGQTTSRGTRVDYKEPRRLHCPDSPPALSTFEEPIWEVLQDMREQRMSLCQSLRQYVFVHAAIIEGALMVVDQERAAIGAAPIKMGSAGGKSHHGHGQSQPGMGGRVSSGEGSILSSLSSTGKRGASPTELLKEGRRGEVSPSKKPSLKRKPLMSSEDYR